MILRKLVTILRNLKSIAQEKEISFGLRNIFVSSNVGAQVGFMFYMNCAINLSRESVSQYLNSKYDFAQTFHNLAQSQMDCARERNNYVVITRHADASREIYYHTSFCGFVQTQNTIN
jgi:hypothetical protein